jgi:hypothetical protein
MSTPNHLPVNSSNSLSLLALAVLIVERMGICDCSASRWILRGNDYESIEEA